jgi:hypothetical protein
MIYDFKPPTPCRRFFEPPISNRSVNPTVPTGHKSGAFPWKSGALVDGGVKFSKTVLLNFSS